jgi:RNA polymerase sigma factor (sigma-70 family)
MNLFVSYKKEMSVEEMIRGCQQSDRKAQRLLYEKFSPLMLAVCRRYCGQLEIAEETMSNGFVKVFKNIGQYENKGSFEGWVRKIMVRESLDYIKTKKDFIISVDTFLPYEEPSENFANHLEAEELLALIDTLPNGYKEVFNLYIIEGLKHHEIAELLEISENTSKSQLMKARLALQKKLEEIKEQEQRSYQQSIAFGKKQFSTVF